MKSREHVTWVNTKIKELKILRYYCYFVGYKMLHVTVRNASIKQNIAS